MSKQKSNWVVRWLGGGVVGDEQFRPVLLFIAFLALLGVFYVGNTFYAIHALRNIEQIEADIHQKRVEYITARTQLVDSTKQSTISQKVKFLGLKEAVEPPILIFVNEEDLDN